MAHPAPIASPAAHPSLDARTLFLTTISAFSCLLKPTRNEIVRMDALLMPLYDQLNDPTKREIATKLAMSAEIPPKMAMRLCLEPLEIAAPLLMTKAPLREELLLRTVAKNGNGHLNIIAKRADVPASVAALIQSRVQPIALKKDVLETRLETRLETQLEALDHKTAGAVTSHSSSPLGKSKADSLRQELRDFMEKTSSLEHDKTTPAKAAQATLPSASSFIPPSVSPTAADVETLDHSKLVRYAINGDVGLFATRVSDCLGVDHSRVRRIIAQSSYSDLLVCLRALYCDSITAFAICAPLFPKSFFGDAAAIALFYQRADGMSVAQAHQTLQDWRLSEVPLKRAQHANQDDLSPSEAIFAQLSSAS